MLATLFTMASLGYLVARLDPFALRIMRLSAVPGTDRAMRLFHCVALPTLACLAGYFTFGYTQGTPWWCVMPLGCSTAMVDLSMIYFVMMVELLGGGGGTAPEPPPYSAPDYRAALIWRSVAYPSIPSPLESYRSPMKSSGA